MTDTTWDLSTVEVEEWVVPDHTATDDNARQPSTRDEPPKTLRERLNDVRSKRETKPRNVKLPPERKSVPNVPGQFIEPVENFYNLMGLTLMPFRPVTAMTIVSPARPQTEEERKKGLDAPTVARQCAVAWDEAAQRNESLRRLLDGFTSVSVMGALIAAHIPIVVAAMSESNNERANAAAEMAQAMFAKQAANEETVS